MSMPSCAKTRAQLSLSDEGRLRCLRCDALLCAGGGAERWYWCGARAGGGGDETVDEGDGPVASAGRFPGYEVLDILGEGGGGRVLRARTRACGSEVALKVMPAGQWSLPRLRLRFQREIGALSRLKVEGVLRVLDAGATVAGVPWFTMPLVAGPSLAEVLAERDRLPPGEAGRVVQALAETLARVHQAGFVHRDIKPSNVLMTPDGVPLLSDFGLALEVSVDERLTRTYQPVGTPRYMAPEQRAASVEDWTRVDTFALGAVLYEALGGDPGEASLDGESLAGAPVELVWIARRACAPDPADRYPSAGAMARDLAAWRAHRTRSWLPLLVRLRGRLWLRRRRARLALAGGVAAGVLLVLGGAQGWRQWAAAQHEASAERAWSEARAEVEALRAQGELALAEARFSRFTGDAARQGSEALGAAWLWEAGRLQAAGDDAGAAGALGWAATAASDPEQRARAAEALLGHYHQVQDWRALAVLVDSLPAVAPSAEVPARLRADLALAFGDVAGALPHLSPEDAALFAPFTRARRFPAVWGVVFGPPDTEGARASVGVDERPPSWEPVWVDPQLRYLSTRDASGGWTLLERAAGSWAPRTTNEHPILGVIDVGGRTLLFDGAPQIAEVLEGAAAPLPRGGPPPGPTWAGSRRGTSTGTGRRSWPPASGRAGGTWWRSTTSPTRGWRSWRGAGWASPRGWRRWRPRGGRGCWRASAAGTLRPASSGTSTPTAGRPVCPCWPSTATPSPSSRRSCSTPRP